MKLTGFLFFIAGLALMAAGVVAGQEPPNPRIDYAGFANLSQNITALRESRRISETDFLHHAEDPKTVILDARSREKYEQLHVKDAKHLNFADFTEESLRKLIPEKHTRILIYCNNNFSGEPRLLAPKAGLAALNIHVFITLHAYGYTNVHELAPLLDIKTTKIPFAGESAK